MAVLGCGSVQSPEDPDAPAPLPDGPKIQISGTIAEAGTPISAAATVDVIEIASGATLATGRSGAAGMFSVAVPTHGAALDAYLAVTSPAHLRTHLYLLPGLGSDHSVYVSVFSEQGFRELAISAGAQQPAGTGAILAQVFAHDQPAADATASVASGPSCYTNPSFVPDCALSATAADGLVWIFAAPPGTATVTGALADTTLLRSRQVRVEANVVVEVGLEP